MTPLARLLCPHPSTEITTHRYVTPSGAQVTEHHVACLRCGKSRAGVLL